MQPQLIGNAFLLQKNPLRVLNRFLSYTFGAYLKLNSGRHELLHIMQDSHQFGDRTHKLLYFLQDFPQFGGPQSLIFVFPARFLEYCPSARHIVVLYTGFPAV